jgi:microcystin-dependent protein
MAKTKISEWSQTASNNTDLNGISCAEGMAPSDVNNWMRELMAQVKDFQVGADGDPLTVAGTFVAQGRADIGGALNVTGAATFNGAATFSGGISGAFITGMIMLWSGSVASIPSGWVLCDGTNSTPDLRSRFVVGAGSTYAVNATGGSADAIVVSHTHTATVTDSGHSHTTTSTEASSNGLSEVRGNNFGGGNSTQGSGSYSRSTNSATTGIAVSNSTTGSSGTNANLPPYYALAYIMKT